MFDISELLDVIRDHDDECIVLVKRGHTIEYLDLNNLLFVRPEDLFPIEETKNVLERLEQ